MNKPLFVYADYLPEATVTATDTAAGLDPVDVLLAEEDNVWQPANQSGAKSLTISLSYTRTVGCLAIVGDMLAGVTLEVRGSSDNFSSNNVQLSAPAAMGDWITHWRGWTSGTINAIRLIFTGMSPDFAVAHVAVCEYAPLPYFADGADLDAYSSEGSNLVAPDGRFLGSNRQRTMRQVKLDWGQVTDTEVVLFERWADACLRNIRPFFFIPDVGQAACWFCWCEPKQRFSSPRKVGMYNIGSISITARIP